MNKKIDPDEFLRHIMQLSNFLGQQRHFRWRDALRNLMRDNMIMGQEINLMKGTDLLLVEATSLIETVFKKDSTEEELKVRLGEFLTKIANFTEGELNEQKGTSTETGNADDNGAGHEPVGNDEGVESGHGDPENIATPIHVREG